MKMVVTHRRFIKLYEELNVSKMGRVKIKDPKQMQVRMYIGACVVRCGPKADAGTHVH